MELKKDQNLAANEVKGIDVEIFDVAYHIMGGGEEGNKSAVSTKEQADHSLPYLLSVAILDDQVMPEQYRQDRIGRKDVQDLLPKIRVRPSEAYSRRFPNEMPCRLTLALKAGQIFVKERSDYEGFQTRPMRWETVVKKFDQLSSSHASSSLRRQIVDAVARLERIQISELMGLLELR